jgi:tyrosine-protein kinase Etk/Wzc
MNLATVLSERGKRAVLVIEADLHRPCLAERLSVTPGTTLTECLQGGLDPLHALRRVEPVGWYALFASATPRNPSELLQTPVCGGLVQKLSPYFDWIIIDSPPAISVTDALLLHQHADATLLVVRAGETPREMVDQAVELLGRKHVVGVILNGVKGRRKNAYYYYAARSGKGSQTAEVEA